MKHKLSPLWMILIPRSDNDGQDFSLKHHQRWDTYVIEQTGGLTIQKPSKGRWRSPKGKMFVEEMIPVLIACGQNTIERIANFTKKHYSQEAVFVFLVSRDCFIF